MSLDYNEYEEMHLCNKLLHYRMLTMKGLTIFHAVNLGLTSQ